MKVLIVNQSEVIDLLPMDECIDVMTKTLTALAQGDAILPLRPIMWLPERVGALGLMPAYLGVIKSMGVKVITVFPGNQGTKYDSHIGAVLLFGAEHGELKAIMDASEITGIRTAAVSGVATRLLAREDAGDLAILGSGVQAATHLEAMLAVRPIRRVRVWSRNPANAKRFAERQSRRRGINVEAMGSAQEAVAGADIICTTTSAPEPVLCGDWIAPGAHVNAVGSSVAVTRELDTAAMVRSKLFVDRRESTLNEAGDFLIPKKEGEIGDDHILGEIGEILIGKAKGRQSPDEITLFKSLGLAVEDVASAYHIYKQAEKKGRGAWIELGGERHADDA
jgi:ornithine cyclodeaminase/alanine dehydrogenase-like protein (mu-crystallin family)